MILPLRQIQGYGPSPLELATMSEIEARDNERKAEYAANWKAYKGLQKEPLVQLEGEENDNVLVNPVKSAINASVDYLFGSPPEIKLPLPKGLAPEDLDEEAIDAELETASEQDDMAGMTSQMGDMAGMMGQQSPMSMGAQTPGGMLGQVQQSATPRTVDPALTAEARNILEAQEWLDECLRVNHWDSLLLDVGINGSITGTAYAAISVDPDDLTPNTENPRKPFARIMTKDPSCMSLRWMQRDSDKIVGYVWETNAIDQTGRPCMDRQLIVKQDNGTWLIRDQRRYLVAGDWQDLSKPTVWPYKWPPVIHCKNLPNPNEAYGAADIDTPVINKQRAMSFNLSNRNRIDRIHGHPKVWAKGLRGQEIDFSVNEVIDIPDPEGELGQLVPAVNSADAKQTGDDIYQAFLEETATPSVVLGRVDAQGIPSGVALRIKMGPLIRKTETKRKLYGPMIEELCRRLLEWAGFGDNLIPTLNWPEIVPVDPLEEAQVNEIDMRNGYLSKATAAGKRGLDWETEEANIDKENSKLDSLVAQQQAAMVQAAMVTQNPSPRTEQLVEGEVAGAAGKPAPQPELPTQIGATVGRALGMSDTPAQGGSTRGTMPGGGMSRGY